MQRPNPWNSSLDGALIGPAATTNAAATSEAADDSAVTTTAEPEKLTAEQAREKYLNFVKNKSRAATGSHRSLLGLYLGPLPETPTTPNSANNTFVSPSANFTNSSTQTLKGYKIENVAATNTSGVRAANLVIDTNAWNKVWEGFFNDEESQDAAYELVKREGKTQSSRAVLLRLFSPPTAATMMMQQQQRGHHHHHQHQNTMNASSSATSTISPAALITLKKDIENQARACGPVEFVRAFDGKEILVQFTTESAARVFQGTCSVTAGHGAGGFLQRMQNEFGIEDPRAVITNAQRIDLVLTLGKQQQQQQQNQAGGVETATPAANNNNNNNNNNNRRTNNNGNASHKKLVPALDLKVAAAEDSADGTTISVRTASGALTYSYGIQMLPSYVKALFSAAGAQEINAIPSNNNDTVGENNTTNNVAPAAVAYKRFYIRFDSFLEAQVALHWLQFPLRRIFGLSLNYTAEEPVSEEEENNKTNNEPQVRNDDGKVAVKGGTNTKFESSEEEED